VSAAELLIVGVPGPDLDDDSAQLLRAVRPGGVILFRRNVDSVERLRELVAAIRRAAPGAILYSDSEGGRVDRLAGVVGGAPSAAELATLSSEDIEKAGFWVGQSLRQFDLDVDLAPVVDLDRGLTGNALDGRCLGSSKETVTQRGKVFLAGLHRAGIGGCLKHFPGLGGARGDTHFTTGLVDLTKLDLAQDLVPFVALGDRAGALLVNHAVYPALDAAGLPASLSRGIATGLLREKLGYAGLLIADDLEMHALAPQGDLAARAAAALAAGCDLLPICHSLAEAPRIVTGLSGARLAPRVREARTRFAAYRTHLEALRATRGSRLPSLETVRRRIAGLAQTLR
jgi:beta-N-acetylhexosaminidase